MKEFGPLLVLLLLLLPEGVLIVCSFCPFLWAGLGGTLFCSVCLAVVTYLPFVRRIRGFVAKIDECRGRYDVSYSDGCRWFL